MASMQPTRGTGREPILRRVLTAYPLACFTGALLTDIAYVRSAQVMWANFSIWLITAGMAMGVAAALSGIVGAFRTRRHGERQSASALYVLGTASMLVLGLINAFVHSRDGWTAVVPGGITLSAIVALLALLTSYILFSRPTQREVR